MIGAIRRYSLAAGALAGLAALALALPVAAQGNSGGKGKGKKSSPPSSSALPSPTAGGTPIAWLDDASLLPPGTMALTIGASRWSGADLDEVDFPVVEMSAGVAPRFQLGATVPRVVAGPDGGAPIGGMGTSYVSGKIAILNDSGVKAAVTPMVEILGEGAAQALAPGQSRARLGLPISLELSQGAARIFAATGIFSGGAWFAGGGVGWQATPRIAATAAFTRAWAGVDATGIAPDRRELSGGVSYVLKPGIAAYGSIGRTIATTDENGAGTSVGGGMTFVLGAAGRTR